MAKELIDVVCNVCGRHFGSYGHTTTCCTCQKKLETVHVNKKDEGKLPWHLLPDDEIEDIVKVLAFGRKKYAQNTWQTIGPDEYGNPPSVRYEDAAKRHLKAWKSGEKLDPESGLSHLAHFACNALFLCFFEKHPELDVSGPDIHKETEDVSK